MSQTQTPIHEAVREHYAERARKSDSCCGTSKDCAPQNTLYPVDLLNQVPTDVANFSFGCGDPITLSAPQPGETVLDLGSGGGLDCFLAAQKVGATGHVIGVDMTPEMLERATASAARLGHSNVEFRQGYLEALPVADGEVDVVISNCVINLSPDKPLAFREAFRALKPGGRLAVSDIVTDGELPQEVKASLSAWAGCIAGALDVKDYVRDIEAAGFVDVRVTPVYMDREMIDDALGQVGEALDLSQYSDDRIYRTVYSAKVTARKP